MKFLPKFKYMLLQLRYNSKRPLLPAESELGELNVSVDQQYLLYNVLRTKFVNCGLHN